MRKLTRKKLKAILAAGLFSGLLLTQGACDFSASGGGLLDASLVLSLSNLPGNLQYDGNSHSMVSGFANTGVAPTYTGYVDNFSVSPSLPGGMSLNTATGEISGTPSATSASAEYVFTAASDFGSTVRAVTLSAWRSLQEGVAAADTRGQGIAVDSAGNIIVSGRTNGALNGQTNTGQDLAVIKYDKHGTRQWTRVLGGAGVPAGYSAATDSSNNIIIVGETTTGFEGNAAIGTNDGFIVKLDSNGNVLWSRVLGVGGGNTYLYSVMVDSSDRITAVGRTDGNLDSQTKSGTEDLVLVRYDSSGNKLFTKLFGTAGATVNGFDIDQDTSGNIYTAGIANANIHGQTLFGTQDMLLIKYDSSGNRIWTRLLGAGGVLSFGDGVDTDSAGNVYICGNATGSIDGQTFNGSNDLVLSKYDSSGNRIWVRMAGASAAVTKAYDLHVDSSGNTFAAGITDGALDSIPLIGTRDMFIIKYDTDGNKQWTRTAGATGANQTEGAWITADAVSVLVPGHSFGNFDGNTVTGSPDMVLYRTPF